MERQRRSAVERSRRRLAQPHRARPRTLGLTRIGFYESAFLFAGFTCWLMLGASESARRAPLRRLTTALAFATGLMIVVYIAFALVIQLPTPSGLFL
jgi:formate/nitrite transporter FocA (FNT family)